MKSGLTRSERRIARMKEREQKQREEKQEYYKEQLNNNQVDDAVDGSENKRQRKEEDVGEEEEEEQQRQQQQQQQQRRGPSVDIDRLINERIAQRKSNNEYFKTASMLDDHEAYIMKQSDGDDHFEEEIHGNYEYLDHTADIQLHSWGDTVEEALENLALSMFGYMTQLSSIEIDEAFSQQHASNISVQGHDMQSLVFAFLQEWLYIFHDTGFIAKTIKVQPIDRANYTVTSSAQGEKLCIDGIPDYGSTDEDQDNNTPGKRRRHQQGTEVKAVTYSNMQVIENDGRCDVFVIVDI